MSKGKTRTETSVELPAWQEAQFKELYSQAQGVARQPFIPYTGPMVAGFSPDQLRQFQATRGLFETGMGYDPTRALQGMAQEQFRPTIQPVTGFQAPTIEATQAPGAAQIGPVATPQFRGLLSQDIGAYQSPYQQQVIDLAMQDIQRQADIARGGAQERAIRAGAFGGSRSAILEAESQRPYAEQMARTAAGLRQAGFEQAQAAAQADLARQQQLGIFGAGQEQQRALQQAQLGQQAGIFGAELGQQRRMQQAALEQQRQLAGLDIAGRAALTQPQLEMQARAQRAGLLGGLAGQQVQGLGLLSGIGAQQQALQQRAIDAQRGEFARALAYPQQQISLLQAGLGTPLISQTTTGSKSTGAGDILGAIAGLGGSMALGGINPFSMFGSGAGAGTGAAVTAGGGRGYFSDERLKENIKSIGTSENGHKLYTWDWNDKAKELGINDPTIGVIAQEVMKYMPEAVSKNTNGYYMVNYGVL
mgnify:CR=1 FL=1